MLKNREKRSVKVYLVPGKTSNRRAIQQKSIYGLYLNYELMKNFLVKLCENVNFSKIFFGHF